MSESKIIIYGATGFTGRLVVKRAVQLGLKPILAGRNFNKLNLMRKEFELETLCFGLENIDNITNNIKDATVVLNCAGPFSETARPMINACLAAKTHYVDITGEIAILEWANTKHKDAVESGIVILCGAGFDVVPTDCVAVKLKELMPDASHLEIGFYIEGSSISHGTMYTMANNLGNTSYTRENNLLVAKPLAHKTKYFSFGENRLKWCMSIPWGDLYSAWVSTGIPNIDTYIATSKTYTLLLKFQFLFNPLLRSKIFKSLFKAYIDRNITGPTQNQLEKGRSYVFGLVRNENGKDLSVCLECAESYQLTALAALKITEKIISNNPSPGFHTPAGLFGSGLIMEIPGSRFI